MVRIECSFLHLSDQQVGIPGKQRLLELQSLIRKGVGEYTTHASVVSVICGDDCVYVVDGWHKPLRVLDDVGLARLLVTVDIFPGAGVVEAEFVRRDANDMTVLLVQLAYHVCVCTSPDMRYHGDLGNGIELRAGVVS